MKKWILLIGLLFLVPQVSILQAQTFTWQADTTNQHANPSPTPVTIEFHTYLINNTAAPIQIRVARIANQIPSGWSSSLCVDFCYPPETDTITVEVPASGQKPLTINMTIDNNPDVGTVTVKTENMANPSEYVINDFVLSTEPFSIKKSGENLTGRFQLYANYPNPFNPATTIPFEIGHSISQKTTLTVYNILGQKIRTLVNAKLRPGYYQIDWTGKNDSGKELPSGIYFYELRSGDLVLLEKMILMR